MPGQGTLAFFEPRLVLMLIYVNFDDIYSNTYIYINISICKGTYGYKNVYIQLIL